MVAIRSPRALKKAESLVTVCVMIPGMAGSVALMVIPHVFAIELDSIPAIPNAISKRMAIRGVRRALPATLGSGLIKLPKAIISARDRYPIGFDHLLAQAWPGMDRKAVAYFYR